MYYLAVGMQGAQGIAAFDDVQLEVGDTVSSVNLLQNSGFEVGSQLSTYWSGIGSTGNTLADPKSEIAVVRGQVLHISGASSADKQVSQNVKINQDSDVTFLLSGWGCADSVPFYAKEDGTYERFFGLIAKITYTDNTTENHYVPFDASYSGWQYATGIIVPKQSNKTVSTVTVQCAYNKNANDAYFDGVSLIEEPVQTYSYDEKGNPIAATDGKAKSASEYYSGTSKLKSYTTPSGTKHELWYDNKNNVQEERLHKLSTYTDYNFAGGVTNSLTSVGYSGDYLASYNWYSPNLHFKVMSQDVNGIETNYAYNTSTRTLASVKNAYGTEQAYGYIAANDRMLQTYIDSVDAIWYAYQNGQLSTLTRKSFPALGSTANPFWQQYALAYDAFGNTTQVSVSGSTDGSTYAPPVMLASYGYESGVNNGRLAQMAYGNGETVNYTYDLFDRKTAETYNDGTSYHYEYDAEGSLAGQYATDSAGATTERYAYEYDSLGRLIHSKELDGSGNMVQRTEHLYDTSNRVRAQNWMFANGASFGQSYTYSDGASGDGTLTKVVSSATMDGYGFYPSVTYTYNTLRQLTRKTTDNLFYRAYSYRLLNGGERRSAQVEFMNYRRSDDNSLLLGYRYTYDEQGNVSAVYKSKATGTDTNPTWTYTYDGLGQLTAATDADAGYSYAYTYDTAGNIRSATASGQNGVNKTFSYANTSWPDLLTSVTVGGTTKSIEYQTVNGNLAGNPTSYYNGTDYTFEWGKGTQLTKATTNSATTKYTYDMSGVRSSKTVSTTKYEFTTLSGLVMQQTWSGKSLYFLYDDSNQPYAMVYKSSAAATPLFYYYLLNQQGDVVALMDDDGKIVARYSYDPWGVPTVMNPNGTVSTIPTFIGNMNPLRYRGYYYDTETGFYYLQSRYYDPVIGRFISADTFATTDCNGFLSANMFAYCENNPVNRSDPSGEIYHIIMGALVGSALSAAAQVISNGIAGQPLTDGLGAAMLSGLITGGFSAGGLGKVGQAIVGGVTSAATYLATHQGDEFSWSDLALETGTGIVGGAAGGRGFTCTTAGAQAERKVAEKALKQIKIINTNVHAANYSWRARRSIITSYSRIKSRVNSTISRLGIVSSIAGAVRGAYYRYKGRR